MSACPAIVTGDELLVLLVTHIDCQAQIIGSYGYLALGQPGSFASSLVIGLLTLFVAFFGVRLILGTPTDGRDIVSSAAKIGIVLALAFSWPAFRTVVYDVTLKAPGEIAGTVLSGEPEVDRLAFPARLQKVDNDMLRLAELRTGRNSGQLIDQSAQSAAFTGTAQGDASDYGMARMLYLSSVIGSVALPRIAAGLLLALAPIVAALYLFTQTRGIFAGWLKGLVLTIGISVGATIILGVQLGVINPWLADAIRLRSLGYAVPSAPAEIFAIMLAFAIVQMVMMWFLAKVVLYRGWITRPAISEQETDAGFRQSAAVPAITGRTTHVRHTGRINNSIESSMRREQPVTGRRFHIRDPAIKP
jgi:type IV secretion system protein VirB6